MKNILMFLVCGLMLLTSGCAAVFTGTTDTVTFDSQPQNAKVLINGLQRGKTPVTVNLKRSLSTTMVSITLEDHEPQYLVLQKEFNFISLFDIFIWPTFIVDAATGAMMKYSPKYYNIELTPKKESK